MNSNFIQINPAMRQRLAQAVTAIGSARKFERNAGLASGHVSKLIYARTRKVTPKVAHKIAELADQLLGPVDGGKVRTTDGVSSAQRFAFAEGLEEISQARTAKLGQLLGRAEAAMEIAEETIDGDAMEKALKIVRHSLGELYTAASVGGMA